MKSILKDLFDCGILLRNACVFSLVILQVVGGRSQNVGINQPNPQWPLDIVAPHGVIRVTTSGSNFGSVLELRNLLTSAPYMGAINFNDSIGLHPGQISYRKDHILTFRTKHFTRMLIDSLGRVGIGGLFPQYPLDVYAEQGVLRLLSSSSDYGSVVELRNFYQPATYLGAINFNDIPGSYAGQISYATDHIMAFRVNALERMRIDSVGRMGIGTSTPQWPLDIEAPHGVLRVTTSASNSGSVLELRNLLTSAPYLGAINFNDSIGLHPGQIGYWKDHFLTFRTKHFTRMLIDSAGRVGIGPLLPEYPLDILSAQGVIRLLSTFADGGSVLELRNFDQQATYLGAINFNDSDGSYPGQISYASHHNLQFRVNSLERMRIDSFGRVGIGTQYPVFPLDVQSEQGVLRMISTTADNGSTVELRNFNQQATYLGAINFNNLNSEYPGQISYTTDDNMLFRVNETERVRIDSLGNVGIGTQSPQYDLDIKSQQAALHLNSTSDVSGSSLVLQNNTPSPVILGSLQFQDSNGVFPEEIVALDTDAMLFKTAGAERLRINHLGYVGIGTQNPQKHLDVASANTTVARITSNSHLGAILELRSLSASDNTTGSIHFTDEFSTDIWIPAIISYNGTHGLSFWANFAERMTIDPDGNIGFGNNEPIWPVDIEADYAVTRMVSTNSTVGAALELKNNTNVSSYLGVINFNNMNNGYPGQIAYQTDNQLTISVNNAERLRINANGLMGVGRQPLTNRLEVEGTASKSSAGDWVANSDVRLKKNIENLNSKEMLDRLLSLKGIKYEWNDDKTGTSRPEGVQYGFTAQNIQKVFPTLVEEDNLGYLQTAYGTYDPMIVEAIRALNEKIINLENKNITLVNENEKLRSDIAEIKNMISSK